MAEVLNYIWIAFIIVFFFGLCIFIHELGHFLVAKLLGLHVNAFSIGFKKVWGFKYGGVDYRIGCIPCGGYVDIPQLEPTEEVKTLDGKPLPRAKPIHRILTALAGPICNILLGFALGVFIWIYGVPQESPIVNEIKVAVVDKYSPEYNAGLRDGDVIYSINGGKFHTTWNGFIRKIIFTVGEVSLGVRRNGKEFVVSYTPKPNQKRTPNEKIAYPFFEPEFPVILYPVKGSPAAKAGLKQGDRVLEVNGEKILDGIQFVYMIRFSEGKPVSLVVDRKGSKVKISNIKPKFMEDLGKGIGILFNPKKPLLSEVIPNSPAAKAGLKKGDIILAVNGVPVVSAKKAWNMIKKNKGDSLDLKLKRGKEEFEKNLVMANLKLYSIGANLVFVNHPTPWEQFAQVIDMTYKTLRGVFSKKSTLKVSNFSGPIGIFRAIGITAHTGAFTRVLNLIVIISFSLGLFNLLPVPVLDGGHISIAFIEIVIRRPLPVKLVQPVTVAFIIILISFMLFVSYYDVRRVYFDFAGKKARAAYSSETSPPPPAVGPKKDAKKDDGQKTSDKKN